MSRPHKKETQTFYTPTRQAQMGADVGVPLAQATITGGLLAALIVFAISQLAPQHDPLLEWWVGLTLLLTAAFWLTLLWQTRRLLWTMESLCNEDLDGDGVIGSPSKRRLSVEVKDGNTRRLVDADWLGMDDDHLTLFVRGLSRREDLTEGRWAGTPAFPEGINAFRKARGKLEEASLIRRKHPGRSNSPFILTPSGKAFVRRVLEAAHE